MKSGRYQQPFKVTALADSPRQCSRRFAFASSQSRQGRLWVATNGAGVARLIDDREAMQATGSNSRQKFISFHISDAVRANRVNALVFDAANNLWCATDGASQLRRLNSEPNEPQTAH
ncbi:MAG TPA: hypothetical protein VFU37_11670 [Pyrinomonadaceae bacterium]|nr:hypothetical protein [Pyrinomonadaceae bacterium]